MINRDIFGPKKGFFNRIKWALVCAREYVRFWAEIRLQEWAVKITAGGDGRPCNTDIFLWFLMNENENAFDRSYRINAWLEGDWAEACEGLSIKLKEPKP